MKCTAYRKRSGNGECSRKATVLFERLAFCVGGIEVVKVPMCTQHGNEMFDAWSGREKHQAKLTSLE